MITKEELGLLSQILVRAGVNQIEAAFVNGLLGKLNLIVEQDAEEEEPLDKGS